MPATNTSSATLDLPRWFSAKCTSSVEIGPNNVATEPKVDVCTVRKDTHNQTLRNLWIFYQRPVPISTSHPSPNTLSASILVYFIDIFNTSTTCLFFEQSKLIPQIVFVGGRIYLSSIAHRRQLLLRQNEYQRLNQDHREDSSADETEIQHRRHYKRCHLHRCRAPVRRTRNRD